MEQGITIMDDVCMWDGRHDVYVIKSTNERASDCMYHKVAELTTAMPIGTVPIITVYVEAIERLLAGSLRCEWLTPVEGLTVTNYLIEEPQVVSLNALFKDLSEPEVHTS